jgi:PPK2 family polyphosphate:nucleotide phosphotransferase
MAGSKELLDELEVAPGSRLHLADRDPGERLGAANKSAGIERLAELVSRLGPLHDRLAAEAKRAVLVVLQGMDASGKDGTIRHVLTGVNPQGCRIVSFREPTETELAHDYLWRVHAACPQRGEIGIFNRSHYEDVVAARVRGLVSDDVWQRRYVHIRGFERMLVDEGTTVLKFFLHVSEDEQRRRLQERLDNPAKRWKFSAEDLADRRHFAVFQTAYAEAIEQTSTAEAPWYVVPADHNWVRNLAVSEVLVATLERLDPHFPAPTLGTEQIEIA